MASYHLSVKTVKRSAGRTATAAAAYRAGERLSCAREGRVHDYTRKQGIEESFILAPADAPGWAQDRASLWNAAEARETRRNSVTAREWELALPSELSAEGRAELARGFAQALVQRYGIAADVAIHAPHRDGDQRNHHAHVLTTTRVLGAEGLTDKTRILDAARTGGVEIADMRGLWAQMQNAALERDGTAYEPVTERGAQVHEVRQQRSLMAELLDRMGRAREAYAQAREADASRLSAATEAARALFSGAGARDFAASFTRAYEDREAERQWVLDAERAQAREAERVAALEAARGQFIERVVEAWQDSREIEEPGDAKERQKALVSQVKAAAERFGCGFDDLAGPVNSRADEIRDQREREAELDSSRHRDKSDGHGL